MDDDIEQDPSDETLLFRIAAGDVESLSLLFRRRQQNVYRFALHLTGSSSMADDVTQDVFVAVIRDARKFEPGRAAVPAWLCGIARNYVRRRLAIDRGAASIDADEGLEAALPAASPDPLQDLTSAEAIDRLRRAVRGRCGHARVSLGDGEIAIEPGPCVADGKDARRAAPP
jgi:RNA polymerase sigma-70 factor (ECF subfamily)